MVDLRTSVHGVLLLKCGVHGVLLLQCDLFRSIVHVCCSVVLVLLSIFAQCVVVAVWLSCGRPTNWASL